MDACRLRQRRRPSPRIRCVNCGGCCWNRSSGSAPADPTKEEEDLSWKTYSWEMRSVWMENILLHRPKRWLPEKYPNYDELLTAAVEAAVNAPTAPETWRRGDGVRSTRWRLSIRSWEKFR